MKQIFSAVLCVCLLVAFHQVSFAQMWQDDYDKGMAAMQKADNIGKGKSELSESEHYQRLELYKAAADAFINSKKISRKMSAVSVYFIATSLYKVSVEQSALGNDVEAYKTIRQAIEYWPDLDVVPASKFTTEQRVKVDGHKQTMQALGDVEDWKHAYFKSYIRATQLANILRRYDEAIDYAEFILDEADTLTNENFVAWSELSKTYKNQNDNCKSAEYAMKAIDGALLYDIETPEDKQVIHDYMPELAVNVSPPKDCRFNAIKWSERAALALARLHNIDDQSFYVLLYGHDAYDHGRKSAELLVALAEAEYYQSQQPKDAIANDNENTNWFAEVEKRKKEFTSDELKRVANLYKIKGDKEMETSTLKKAKSRYFWENTHIALSTNPVNFYWGQYLGAFHLMLPKAGHEIRVNYNSSSTHMFWKRSDDKTPGAVFFTFSGYELSYTFKRMERDIKGTKSKRFYSGPQLRIENREYVPVNVNVAKNNDPSNITNKRIEARSDRYEALLMLGTQNRGKWLFIDYFFGVGIGYKTFETKNLEADDKPMDDRFNPNLWNKAYVPVHAGFRIGVILN